MPHQCTNCGRTFPDGSKEMLSGCPNCGGNKFQFLPSSATSGPASPETTSESDTDFDFGETARDPPDNDIIDADAAAEAEPSPEDRAQASARSAVVSPDELSYAGVNAPVVDNIEARADEEGAVAEGEDPDIEQLRAELNEQFESIKVVEPGQYELNLMELYDREEYIVALEEDGRYVIDVPDSWRE